MAATLCLPSGRYRKMCQPGTADYPHISLYYYIQYHLHLQLLSATEYARQHGVVLKGDIPIGISRNSVEAWTEPHYFNLNGQAGAPPDDSRSTGKLGIPHIQLGCHGKRRIPLVDEAFSENGRILRCLPDRSYPRVLPYLGNTNARCTWIVRPV